MNFYKHHLGDYDGHTAHLSWDEDMAYTRLIRAYYRREKPFADQDEAFRLCRAVSKAQKAAIATVLVEFFTLEDDGWHNKRCDEEVATYQAQATTNRRIARERSVQRTVDEPLDDSQQDRTPNQEPLTKNQNHEPEKQKSIGSRFALTELPEDWLTYCKTERPELDPSRVFAEFRDYWIAVAGAKARKADWLATWRTWVRRQEVKRANGNAPPWWSSDAGIEAKAKELGVVVQRGESWQQLKGRINERINSQ